MKIPSPFISRVSNATVRQRSGHQQLSLLIRKAQLRLYGQVLNTPQKKPLREVAFHRGSLTPETAAYVRRVGRPRQNWTEQLMWEAQRIAP